MKRNYHANLAFLDVLFNTLLCFAALFALSFILIKPKDSEQNVEVKAEFILTVVWPKDMDNDVDTYVEDPAGNLVAFMRREEGLMHLSRDDVGITNDRIQTPFGTVAYDENREIITFRGVIPGEYVVNVHMYTKRDSRLETPVTVQLDKINPFQVITRKKTILLEKGDEKTVFRFVVDNEKEVTSLNELPKSLIATGAQLPEIVLPNRRKDN